MINLLTNLTVPTKVDGGIAGGCLVVLGVVKAVGLKEWLEVSVLFATLTLLVARLYFVFKNNGKDPEP